jgi:diguanylate cyclase (GGDEF)-like protein
VSAQPRTSLADFVVDRVDFGIFAVDRSLQVLLWNRFMRFHSAKNAEDVLGKNLFESFPDLPRKWLEKKFESVFVLKNFSFTSWEHRPYLFRFRHDRPVTGGVDYMQQNCTFMPLVDAQGEVEAVCVTVADATDACLIRRELDRTMTALRQSANLDALTGIFNRGHLEERLCEEFARYKRYGGEFSLLMFDLDNFKRINDQYGHLTGDAVLRATAARVSAAIRTMDIFGRYGGEEFALVLPATGLAAATSTAEKIRDVIAKIPVEFGELHMSVAASVGVSAVRPDVASYEALIAEVDSALYAAKAQGRNRCVAFQPAPAC